MLEWEYGELGDGFDRIVDMKELQRTIPDSLARFEAAWPGAARRRTAAIRWSLLSPPPDHRQTALPPIPGPD